MPLTGEDDQEIDQALQVWRQGDVSLDTDLEFLHFADLTRPHSPASVQVADALEAGGEAFEAVATAIMDQVRGVVMLGQTCDIVRGCSTRPFVDVAPLVEVGDHWIEEIRRLKRPAFAYVPRTAGECFVADLDRVMTVEKALVAGWTRSPGWETDVEGRDFARALARKRSRFAFPDDFVVAAGSLQAHLVDRHNNRVRQDWARLCGRSLAALESPMSRDAAIIDGYDGCGHDEIPDFANDGMQGRFIDQQRVPGQKRSPLPELLGVFRECPCEGQRAFTWNGRRAPFEASPYRGGEGHTIEREEP